MQSLKTKIRQLMTVEHGQALGEYALVLALVAVVASVALTLMGVAITGFFQNFVSLWP